MKNNLIQIISICLLILSCQNKECNCEIFEDLIIKNDSIISSIINQPRNEFQNYWNRFNEPVLDNPHKESYRFSITVLLYDYFKVYRIEKNKKVFNLHIKEYAVSTTTRFREDSLVSSYSKEISENGWLSIANSFKENCFWTMPVDIVEDDGYLDGSGWVLEGIKEDNYCTKSKYHLVYRTSPDSSKFVMICEKFMELDSLNVRNFSE